MNDNARRVQALKSTNVDIDCKQGNQAIGLAGILVCQKPRNFRLKARVLGKPGADIGSNDNEFWFWTAPQGKEKDYVFHCAYADLNKGQVQLPFPFQPEMVISAMGIGEFDEKAAYEIKTTKDTVDLIEPVTVAAGKRVRKITVFNRYQVSPPRPQVIAQILQEENGKDICKATILEVKGDPATNAILPVKIHLSWPEQKMEMTMKMHDVQTTRLEANQVAKLFTRADMGIPGFDLARRRPDQAAGVTQGSGTSFQRTGGRQPGSW